MQREAEFRSGQAAVPPSASIIGNGVTPIQLPMDGGAPSTVAAAPSAETRKDESMEDAGRGTMGVSRGREDSPPRAEEVEEVITWNDKQLCVLEMSARCCSMRDCRRCRWTKCSEGQSFISDQVEHGSECFETYVGARRRCGAQRTKTGATRNVRRWCC